jgi:hypothetical protein
MAAAHRKIGGYPGALTMMPAIGPEIGKVKAVGRVRNYLPWVPLSMGLCSYASTWPHVQSLPCPCRAHEARPITSMVPSASTVSPCFMRFRSMCRPFLCRAGAPPPARGCAIPTRHHFHITATAGASRSPAVIGHAHVKVPHDRATVGDLVYPSEPMGGGADTWTESKCHSIPGLRPGHGEKPLSYPWVRGARRGWQETRRPWRGGVGDENSRQLSGSRQDDYWRDSTLHIGRCRRRLRVYSDLSALSSAFLPRTS